MTELICIVCPKGCRLKIDKNLKVTGNGCPRGEVYGKREVSDPHRTVTSTVYISGALHPRLPVKTDREIKKEDIFRVMQAIRQVRVTAPIKVGDELVKNIGGTEATLISTKTVEKEVN